jgi:hypothetical protein
MKAFFLSTLTFCLGLLLPARMTAATYSPDQLDQLLGPIALYPDPLIALILPASTLPSDLTLAANYLAANGSPSGIDAQAWDPSVKGLARYPEVVKWMNDNLDWTQSLGAAFAQQPSDVMKSIQQLRAQARAAGTLVDTPQQKLDVEGDDIRIIPAQQDTIYVPEYDSSVVYDSAADYSGPAISFGIGFPVGAWLTYQLDWDNFGIWTGPWNRGWGYQRGWLHPGVGAPWHAWHPDPRRSREIVRNFYHPEARPPLPHVITGYRAPARRAEVAPRAPVVRSVARPDYRGRAVEAPRPATPPPSQSQLFGGYGRGTQTRDFSNRGQNSRSAPVRAMPQRSAPAPRAMAPASRPAPQAPANNQPRR